MKTIRKKNQKNQKKWRKKYKKTFEKTSSGKNPQKIFWLFWTNRVHTFVCLLFDKKHFVKSTGQMGCFFKKSKKNQWKKKNKTKKKEKKTQIVYMNRREFHKQTTRTSTHKMANYTQFVQPAEASESTEMVPPKYTSIIGESLAQPVAVVEKLSSHYQAHLHLPKNNII